MKGTCLARRVHASGRMVRCRCLETTVTLDRSTHLRV
jgi:hypothetical protein